MNEKNRLAFYEQQLEAQIAKHDLSGIDLHAELEKIRRKTSMLSRSRRDGVVRCVAIANQIVQLRGAENA